jgi:hypothetical protein
MKNIAISYVHLENFTAIWYYLCPFGIVCGLWYLWTKINLATLLLTHLSESGEEGAVVLEVAGHPAEGLVLAALLRVEVADLGPI